MKKERRAQGLGSVYQDNRSGRWVACIRVRGRSVKEYARTKDEAVKRLKHLHRQYDGHDMSTETVAAYMAGWLRSNAPAWKQSTRDFYEKYTRVHVIPALGDQRLDRLSGQSIQMVLDAKRRAGLSETTVGHIYAVLHAALESAVNFDLLLKNPLRPIRKPRQTHRTNDTFTRPEAWRFLAAAGGDRMGALYVVALSTGMRQGELLALRWRDVRLDEGSLSVRETLQRRGDTSAPKTRAGSRRVALSPMALEALAAHRARQAQERRSVDGWTGDLVFPDEAGQPYSANRLRKAYQRILRKAGLADIRFHDLRHTCATLALEAGVNPKAVSEMLGHSRVQVTLDLYGHVTPIMHQQVARTMQDILSETAVDGTGSGPDSQPQPSDD